jgi:hypothetical protein
MKRLRFYHIYNDVGDWCAGVISETAKEAKKIIYGDERVDCLSWIEFSAKWARGVDITGFEEGIFEDCLEAHKREIYNSYGTSEGCEYCEANAECIELGLIIEMV